MVDFDSEVSGRPNDSNNCAVLLSIAMDEFGYAFCFGADFDHRRQ